MNNVLTMSVTPSHVLRNMEDMKSFRAMAAVQTYIYGLEYGELLLYKRRSDFVGRLNVVIL
jgi:hypothetical protein